MKIHVLTAAILTSVLFLTVDLKAQTTLYPSSQPMVKGGTFEIERIVTVWTHCEGESTGTDKVYSAYKDNGYSTTQPSSSSPSNCHDFYLSEYMGYYEFVGSTEMYKGFFSVDQDKNVLVTLNDGTKFLLITDQLMDGILVRREAP